MRAEVCFSVFFDLPFRNSAFPAESEIPFIAQPPCRTASFGMTDSEGFVAVRGYPGLVFLNRDVFDTVQETASGRPQPDLLDEEKEVDLLAVIFIFDFLFGHALHLSLHI